MDNDKYSLEKENALKKYKQFKPVINAALRNQTIRFTSEGFNHLLYKNARTARNLQDQLSRFKLLDLAYKVLSIATTYQEFEEILQEVEVKKYKKRFKESIIIQYWGFIAILDNRKIKVIVRKMGNNDLQFWSVIPFWRTTKHGDLKFRNFSTGDVVED